MPLWSLAVNSSWELPQISYISLSASNCELETLSHHDLGPILNFFWKKSQWTQSQTWIHKTGMLSIDSLTLSLFSFIFVINNHMNWVHNQKKKSRKRTVTHKLLVFKELDRYLNKERLRCEECPKPIAYLGLSGISLFQLYEFNTCILLCCQEYLIIWSHNR